MGEEEQNFFFWLTCVNDLGESGWTHDDGQLIASFNSWMLIRFRICCQSGNLKIGSPTSGLDTLDQNFLTSDINPSVDTATFILSELCTLSVSVAKFSLIQNKMVSTRSGKPVCAPPRLSEVSPVLSF